MCPCFPSAEKALPLLLAHHTGSLLWEPVLTRCSTSGLSVLLSAPLILDCHISVDICLSTQTAQLLRMLTGLTFKSRHELQVSPRCCLAALRFSGAPHPPSSTCRPSSHGFCHLASGSQRKLKQPEKEGMAASSPPRPSAGPPLMGPCMHRP